MLTGHPVFWILAAAVAGAAARRSPARPPRCRSWCSRCCSGIAHRPARPGRWSGSTGSSRSMFAFGMARHAVHGRHGARMRRASAARPLCAGARAAGGFRCCWDWPLSESCSTPRRWRRRRCHADAGAVSPPALGVAAAGAARQPASCNSSLRPAVPGRGHRGRGRAYRRHVAAAVAAVQHLAGDSDSCCCSWASVVGQRVRRHGPAARADRQSAERTMHASYPACRCAWSLLLAGRATTCWPRSSASRASSAPSPPGMVVGLATKRRSGPSRCAVKIDAVMLRLVLPVLLRRHRHQVRPAARSRAT